MPHHTPKGKIDINRVTKEELIHIIDKYGCKMLKSCLKGDETKEEIILFLMICDCPVLKKMFSLS